MTVTQSWRAPIIDRGFIKNDFMSVNDEHGQKHE